jgi:hypothetical protein
VVTGIANLALTGTSRFVGRMRSDLIENLKKDSKVLEDIATNFRKQTNSFQIASFIEQDITPPLKSRVCITSAWHIFPTKILTAMARLLMILVEL